MMQMPIITNHRSSCAESDDNGERQEQNCNVLGGEGHVITAFNNFIPKYKSRNGIQGGPGIMGNWLT